MNRATKRRCIGCGIRPVNGRRYCRVCKWRLAASLPLDLESWPTFRDSRHAKAPDPRPVDGPPLRVQPHQRAPSSVAMAVAK